MGKLAVVGAWIALLPLLVTLVAGFLAGVSEAVSAIVTGNAASTSFSILALVILGWFGGFISGRNQERGDGAMRLAQVLATIAFLGVMIWFRRESMTSISSALAAAPSLLASLLVWIFVVITPWIAISEANEQEKADRTGG